MIGNSRQLKMPILIISVCLFITYPGSVASESGCRSAFVEWVYDGDTVRVIVDTQKKMDVRVRGIDCPESRQNDKCARDAQYGGKGCRWQIPHGRKAKRRAIKLLAKKRINLKCGGKCEPDSYKRALRYIHLPDGRDFGLLMLLEGLCEDISRRFPHPRSSEYKEAEQTAKKQKRGIWKGK